MCTSACRKVGVIGKQKEPALLGRVRNKARLLHLAKSTEAAYVKWIVDFLVFHRHRTGAWVHPMAMQNEHVNRYLEHLAVERHVAASTQNQALSAMLFLFTKVLEKKSSLMRLEQRRHNAFLLYWHKAKCLKSLRCSPREPCV